MVIEQHQLSERRACRVVGILRSVKRYQSKRKEPLELISQLRQLAYKRKRFGYRRLHVMLKREGIKVNHKRVYRLYQQAGLVVRLRQRQRICNSIRRPIGLPMTLNESWSMDFVADGLCDGRRIRCLNIVDDLSKESVQIEVDTSISGERVMRVLELLKEKRGGLPKYLRCDNGPEFRSKALDLWAYQNQVELNFIEPGKPMQNAYIESFNGKFRDECLNEHWFISLKEAKEKIEAWRQDYNKNRPHSSLGYQTPQEFIVNHQKRHLPTANTAFDDDVETRNETMLTA